VVAAQSAARIAQLNRGVFVVPVDAADACPLRRPVPAGTEKHLAIVPAYNEEGSIVGTIRDLRAHAPSFDVLVVDDGSTDRTAEFARTAGARVLRHPFNLGIGGAVQSGYLFALENDYDVAVQVDGDGQHDARHIADLLGHLRTRPDVNLVTGSRFVADDGDGYRSSASRRMGIRLFARILSAVTRRPVTDPTSGFRMADRRAIELFARDYPHDYPEVEAVLLVHAHRLEGAEIPVQMRPRQAGTSSINASRSALYMIKVLLAVFVGLLRARPAVEPGDSAPVQADHAV
jgi:glycosyltransferase involved in cell wall biosynthesis